MGRDISERMQTPLETRPAILMVGSSNAGKRTLLSRLIGEDFSDMENITSKYSCYGWTIDTKYYTADVSIWVEHLGDEFPVSSSPTTKHPSALVLVFDLNNISSFVALQDWASANELHNFEILLCVGNKADLIPSHSAHTEYRRCLQKRAERSSDPHPESLEYGILDSEGCSLLGGEGEKEDGSSEIRNLCVGWCQEHNIEYVEACAANADFDKCLSMDGDIQGVDRIYGALSAYMWPGLIMKSEKEMADGNAASMDTDAALFSDEESDIEIGYEILSKGSAEPWDDTDDTWVSLNDPDKAGDSREPINGNVSVENHALNSRELEGSKPDEMVSVVEETLVSPMVSKNAINPEHEDTKHSFDDLEQLMCEISHVRENLRLMPDIQRKEMAAKLAMKMATMFADSSDDDVN